MMKWTFEIVKNKLCNNPMSCRIMHKLTQLIYREGNI
jgi:hypothetical protein